MVFFTTGFLAVVFFTVVFLVVALAGAGLILPALALLAARDLSLAALFLLIIPFLTAVSILLWAVECELLLGLTVKALSAALRPRFVFEFLTAALWATRTRFLADLIIGIEDLLS